MIGRSLKQVAQVARRTISTSAPRLHGDDPSGVIGANLPFSIENPWTLAIKFALFFGSAFSFPFWVTRHNQIEEMKKAYQGMPEKEPEKEKEAEKE